MFHRILQDTEQTNMSGNPQMKIYSDTGKKMHIIEIYFSSFFLVCFFDEGEQHLFENCDTFIPKHAKT